MKFRFELSNVCYACQGVESTSTHLNHTALFVVNIYNILFEQRTVVV